MNELQALYDVLNEAFIEAYNDYAAAEDIFGEAYYQGKKDALRIAMAMVSVTLKTSNERNGIEPDRYGN